MSGVSSAGPEESGSAAEPNPISAGAVPEADRPADPSTVPAAEPSAGSPTEPAVTSSRRWWQGLLYLLASSGIGAVAGVLWWQIVDLPVYTVGADGGASTTERGLTEYVAGDAWFSLIGFVVGACLGWFAWRLFRRSGWVVVPLVVGASVLAALVCWLVGWEFGPGPFPPRLADAQPGSLVPIELTVRARAAVLVWPFAAVLVTLLGSSLGRDDEEPRPIFAKRSHRASSP